MPNLLIQQEGRHICLTLALYTEVYPISGIWQEYMVIITIIVIHVQLK